MEKKTREGAPMGGLGLARSLRPSFPSSVGADPAQARLGRALSARVMEATRLTALAAVETGLAQLTPPSFARQIRDVHTLTSRAIARFLISSEGTTETERNFVGRVGMIAARAGLSPAVLARSYVLWLDTSLQVLNEEVNRLGVGNAVSELARKVIRSSAESGLRRMVRAYDYQLQAVARVERPWEAALGGS
ncbi:MAG: hypothetical protein ACYDAL_11905 [Candidatus Dormibacteraceae bacterium]